MKTELGRQIEDYRRQGHELLKKLGEKAALPKGACLRRPQRSSMDIYFLVEGLCALCVEGASGKDMALIYFFPGRMINFLPAMEKYYPRRECALCFNAPFADFFVKAIKDCELLRVDYEVFMAEFVHSLPLQTLIIQSLVQNSYDLFTHMLKSLEMPAWQRVARELLENMDGPHPHILPRKITYAEIATHLSIHTVTVAKIFRALQDDGTIERVKNGIMIRDPERIWRIANGEERLFYKSGRSSRKGPAEGGWHDFGD
ncbi:MAG: Crp/Fnr family transcriptional regulator [Desulfovibrio sp.]|nr:Crp/Fnr family transcriptional regulator [Desulfovibrio sp.]